MRIIKISEPDEQVELFKELARHFQKTLPFTKEVSGTTSDEQYIRNIEDSCIVFKKECDTSAKTCTANHLPCCVYD